MRRARRLGRALAARGRAPPPFASPVCRTPSRLCLHRHMCSAAQIRQVVEAQGGRPRGASAGDGRRGGQGRPARRQTVLAIRLFAPRGSRRLLSRGTAPRSRTPCPCRVCRHSAPRSSSAALPAPRRGCSTLPSPRPPPGLRTSAKRSTTRTGSCGKTRRRSIWIKLFSDGAYPPIRTRWAPGETRTAHAPPSRALKRAEGEAALRSTRRARRAQVDVNGNSEGLGRGITWAVHPDFCDEMKPRFPEENFNVQLYNMWKVESIFLACSVRRDGPEMRPRRGPPTARPLASRTSRRRSAPPRARGRTTIR